ncbi:MAG: Fe-S protein assembly chaperone HscA [Planctomycetota bacterium]|jgi:molecular chaperone DnaK (HSP70)
MSTGSDAEHLILGIDLGTTNSLAALMSAAGPQVIRAEDGSALIPSVVSFEADGSVLVGREARARALEQPERTVYSVKRLLGRSGEELSKESEGLAYRVEANERGLARVSIGESRYSPEEISAIILSEVKRIASAALGREVREVVVTVPAYFDDGQRQATKDAAELAGLHCLRIVNEPTAASLAYGIDGSKDGKVLVYDLGGGTFDVSILRIQDGVFRVLATAGNTQLGGDDFDLLLAERMLASVEIADSALEGSNPFVRQAIRKSAEQLKIQLSESEEANILIDLGQEEPFEFKISRSEFEALIEPLIEETMACCRRALADAELNIEDMDELVLVGGSTRLPLVRRSLAEMAGREPHSEVDPDTAVALGAAIQAGILAGGSSDLLLLDVIPLSLGLETMGGVVSKLIMRNATIPASVTEEFSTQVDNQTAVDINIYQGEREKVEDCRKLAAFKLRGIPPLPAGLPRVEVTFLVDENGVLRVLAKELRTGTEAAIQVLPSFGLSRDEVRAMVQDSIEQAIPDLQARALIEVRNKAKAMVVGTRRALELSDLPPDESWSLRAAVDELDRLLAEQSDEATLNSAVDKLSSLSTQIADDMISSAVTKALREEA